MKTALSGEVAMLDRTTREKAAAVSAISIIEGAVFKETEGTVDRRTFYPPASVLA